MACFSLSVRRNAERRKRIVVVLTIWLQMCIVVSSLFILLASEASLYNYRPRKRKRSNDTGESSRTDSVIVAARMLSDIINQTGDKLCKSIGTETYIQQRVEQLDSALSEIEGLTEDERDTALDKIPDHPAQMLVFFSLASSRRLRWVRRFLTTH